MGYSMNQPINHVELVLMVGRSSYEHNNYVDQMGYPMNQTINHTNIRYRKWLKAPRKIYIQNVRGLITENSIKQEIC